MIYAVSGKILFDKEREPKRRKKMSVVVTCRNCGEPIKWLKTRSGKNIPVDDDGEAMTGDVYDKSRHSCHFDTCAKSDRPRGGGK